MEAVRVMGAVRAKKLARAQGGAYPLAEFFKPTKSGGAALSPSGTRIAVVENLGDFDGERDMAKTVDYLFELGMDKLQVAFVVGRIELVAHMEHGEILALERGANGRVFGNATVAERWLRHGGL